MSLKELYRINPKRFILLVILQIFTPAVSIVNIYVAQQEANIVLTKNLRNYWLISFLALTLMFISYGVFAWFNYLSNKQMQEISNQVRAEIVDHYYHDGKEHQVAAMQNRLTNDLEIVMGNYYEPFLMGIYGATLVVGVIVYLIILNWLLLITILLMVAVSLLLPKLTEKPLQKATKMISDSNQVYLDSLNEWLSGLAQIRQFFAGAKLFSVSSAASKKLEDATVKQTAYQKLLEALNGIVSAIFGLILFVLAGFFIKDGQLTIGTLVIVGSFRFYLNSGINRITSARGSMKGTTKLLDEIDESAAKVQPHAQTDLEIPSIIKTKDLCLQFPNGEKLTYPDLTINQGEKILLTGDSGSGKSTLFKLILGGLKPSKGKVIFEDHDGKEIEPDLSKIGYIPQDPIVFPASIEDNITMFNEKLDGKVEAAVKEVNFDEDIDKFDKGLQQKLNLDKLNISGGQRQKIVLARAKVHNSDIILIDEGTSAIDQTATMNILKNLVKSKATIVFIAHNFNEGMRQLFDREIHLVKE